MIEFVYPTETSTLYSNYNVLNTGADEILEVASDFTPTNGPMISRSLLLFSNEDIISDYKTTNNYVLNLKVVQSIELESNTELELYPVSESWENGKGRFADKEVLYPGVSWLYKNKEKETWNTNTPTEYESGGGSWFDKYYDNELNVQNQLSYMFTFNKSTSDVKIDITELVKFWNMSAIVNNGIILKFKNDNTKRCGNVKFFSSNTNTIYQPYLEIGKYDYIFDPYVSTNNVKNTELRNEQLSAESLDTGSLDTGSLDTASLETGSIYEESTEMLPISKKETLADGIKELDSTDLHIFVENINETYSKTSLEKIKVGVRESSPKKSFSNRMRYSGKNVTKEDIFFSVVDAETEELVIDFSEFTKISCDNGGHFFKFNFKCLSRGRLYKFILKLESNDIRKKYEDKRTFMITN
tara:strand:+ start:9064 stop:10302 length:1239 start_codon:yes stop_codon:yes gene_type:complete